MSTDQATFPGGSAGIEQSPSRTAALRVARSAVLAWVDREAALLVVFVVYALVMLTAMPVELLQDSWLTLVSGREVVEHGLPATDTLNAWTFGVEWVDQQWLAQVMFYALWAAGGIKLAMLAHVALIATGFASALAAARSLGASPRSVWPVALVAMFVAPWALQMRAESFAVPLFVWVLWLLAADSRRPSHRVYLVFPLLAVWANLHGTVVLAALFVALRGVTFTVGELRSSHRRVGWMPRGLVLILLPFACLFASPYGLDLAGYYRSLLLNPPLRAFIEEWAVSSPGSRTIVFYGGAFAAVWLLARQRNRLTVFEQLALLVALGVGMSAIRSITWFGFASILFVPRLLEAELSRWGPRPSRRAWKLTRVGIAFAVLACVVGAAVARPDSWYTGSWPQAAGERVAGLAAGRPEAKVFSDHRYANWLLWQQPELKGRIAYDVRFELFTREQLRVLQDFRDRTGDGWRRALQGYDIVAIDRRDQEEVIAALRTRDGFELAYADERLVVLSRG
jgi:hypothetical protein